jgi:hypothetical protein
MSLVFLFVVAPAEAQPPTAPRNVVPQWNDVLLQAVRNERFAPMKWWEKWLKQLKDLPDLEGLWNLFTGPTAGRPPCDGSRARPVDDPLEPRSCRT